MRISWIEPDILAASGIPVSAADIYSLSDEGIGAIISLTEQPLMVLREITPELFNRLDIVYHHAPIDDMQPPDMDGADRILRIIATMTAQGRATLIHCHAGIGRTGTMAHAYLMSQGLSLEQAQARIHECRAVCRFFMLSDTQQTFLYEFAARMQSR